LLLLDPIKESTYNKIPYGELKKGFAKVKAIFFLTSGKEKGKRK